MKTLFRFAGIFAPLGLALVLTFGLIGDVHAKPRKTKRVPAVAAAKNEAKPDNQVAQPGDPRINEGAQGRRNATVDAAAAAEGPINDRRP